MKMNFLIQQVELMHHTAKKNDVTPPEKREFPSVGPAETDFVSRPNGRTTGRMVGHEPGTENNL